MSDSINEQRCKHGKTGKHRVDLIPRLGMWTLCPGPSVVTPPAQDEQRKPRGADNSQTQLRRERAIAAADERCREHWPEARSGAYDRRCCRFPKTCLVAAAPSVSTDHTDEPQLARKCHLTTTDLFRLELACTPLHRLDDDSGPFGVYLVGSTWTTAAYRDVDVRMILHDELFDRLFSSAQLWASYSFAVSRMLAAETGLPIDFQVQRMTEANERYGGQPRNPLGRGHRDFAGLGDATPYYEREVAGRG